jgi:hypothetical protein
MQGRFLGCVGGFPVAGFALPRPRTGSRNKLALCGVEGDAGLVQVVERETGRAAATDTGAAIFHGVVAGMATAVALHGKSPRFIQTWPLLSTSAAGDSFSSRISYSDAQATHAADAQLIPAPLVQTPTHSHSSNSKVSDEYRNIFCELRPPATCRPR